jgi:hypothetical protein
MGVSHQFMVGELSAVKHQTVSDLNNGRHQWPGSTGGTLPELGAAGLESGAAGLVGGEMPRRWNAPSRIARNS